MKLRRKTLFIALILVNAIALIPPIPAAPATAMVALNVRGGPGINYPVIDTLEAGERVNSTRCASGWCFIEQSGPDGWVSENYLRIGGPQRPDLSFQDLIAKPAQPRLTWPFQPAPSPFPSARLPTQLLQFPWPGQAAPTPKTFTFPGGIGGGIGGEIGGGIGDGNGAAPAPSPYQACFFAGENFTAQSKCVTYNRSFSRLGPEWNNRISSLTIKPGTRVTLCQRPDFKSPCLSFKANVPVLPPQLNNKVTSGRVF